MLDVVTWRPPPPRSTQLDLWPGAVCTHVKSNAIVYARDGPTVGIGAGQMSRVLTPRRSSALKAVIPIRPRCRLRTPSFLFPMDSRSSCQGRRHGGSSSPAAPVKDQDVIAAEGDSLGIALVVYRESATSDREVRKKQACGVFTENVLYLTHP